MVKRFLIVIIALLLLSVVALFAQAPVIGPNDAIGFDYTEADFALYVVDRFEASYDGAGWASLGVPPVASVVNGITTYRVIPPQASGTHTVAFRACNAVGCSTSSGPFAFAVLGAPSTAPSNVRKIPR